MYGKLTGVLLFYLILCPSIAEGQSLFGERVESREDWNKMFIHKSGWFGGDGIFAIPLDGKEFITASENTKSLLIFSDTMIGNIKDSRLKSGDFTMIHNSVALLKGKDPIIENIDFYWSKEDGRDHAIFDPKTPKTAPGDYYWLGDGFVNVDDDSTLYIFGYRIRNTESAVFGFEQVGTTLIAIPPDSNPPFEDHKQFDTPLFLKNEGIETTFGSGIYVNTTSAGAPDPDGFVYVYGVRGQAKELVVGRVAPKDFLDFEKWEYWSGFSWGNDIGSLYPIARNVSNEMSVSPTKDGRVILTYQISGLSTEVAVQIGNSPIGPFFPIKKIWNTAEVYEDMDFFTYNAKGYPHLSDTGYLLISYNINSFDFWSDILDKPNLYRPRFIQLKLD